MGSKRKNSLSAISAQPAKKQKMETNVEGKVYSNEDLLWMNKLAYYRPFVSKLLQERKISIDAILDAKIRPEAIVDDIQDWFNIEEEDVLPEKF